MGQLSHFGLGTFDAGIDPFEGTGYLPEERSFLESLPGRAPVIHPCDCAGGALGEFFAENDHERQQADGGEGGGGNAESERIGMGEEKRMSRLIPMAMSHRPWIRTRRGPARPRRLRSTRLHVDRRCPSADPSGRQGGRWAGAGGGSRRRGRWDEPASAKTRLLRIRARYSGGSWAAFGPSRMIFRVASKYRPGVARSRGRTARNGRIRHIQKILGSDTRLRAQ